MIIGLFPGLTTVGGVQLAGRQSAAALAMIARERKWPLVFLSLSDSSGEQKISVGGIEFCFTGYARSKWSFAFQAFSLARQKPAVIFAAHPNLAPIVAMMKTVSAHTRTIVATHGIEVWNRLPMTRRIALRHTEIVTAPSSDTAQKLASVQGVTTGRIRQIPWPVDAELYELASSVKPCPPAGFPKGRIVLSVGRWAANERYKGADLLIGAAAELAAELPDFHLVLVGTGDDLPRLKRLASVPAVSERVHFFFGLSRQELAGCYAAADIFALPSTGEGFGLVYLEAMVFGKPVIGTKLGGIPDVVTDGREGLLVEPTVRGVSDGLRRLLSNGSCRSEMGNRAKERVEREFTFSRFQQRLAEIIS